MYWLYNHHSQRLLLPAEHRPAFPGAADQQLGREPALPQLQAGLQRALQVRFAFPLSISHRLTPSQGLTASPPFHFIPYHGNDDSHPITNDGLPVRQ